MYMQEHFVEAREELGFFGVGGGFVIGLMVAMLAGVVAAHHAQGAEQLLVHGYEFAAAAFR